MIATKKTQEQYLSNPQDKRRKTGNGKPVSEDANFREVYKGYKQGASRRGLEWELTREGALIFFSGDCFYCGVPPGRIRNSEAAIPFVYNGIDRLNPLLGYIPDNCVSCCTKCNYIKAKMTQGEFENYIIMVYDNIMKRRRDS